MGGKRALGAAWIAIFAAACSNTGTVAVGPDYDPTVWTQCSEPQGVSALQQGEARLADAKPGEALPFLLVAVERCPRLVRAHERYQDVARQLGGEAEQAMRRYYEEMPAALDRPEVAWAKARLLTSNANRLAAVEAILQRDSSFPYAQLSQARLLRDFEKYDASISAFERALSLDGSLADARLELADLLTHVGRGLDARPYFEDYVRARPTDRAARRDLVRLLLYELEDPRAAEPHVQELLRLDADDPDTMLDQAAVFWRLDRLQEARSVYQHVLRADDGDSRAALNLGNLYFEPLAKDEAGRREYWPLARQAYRYFLALGRTADGFDAFDQAFAVPFRLREIDEFLGPADGPVPSAADL